LTALRSREILFNIRIMPVYAQFKVIAMRRQWHDD